MTFSDGIWSPEKKSNALKVRSGSLRVEVEQKIGGSILPGVTQLLGGSGSHDVTDMWLITMVSI